MASSESSLRDPRPLRPPPPTLIQTSTRRSSVRSTSFDSQHSPTRSPVRAPTITRHSSRMIALPTPDLVGSIASGAHYAGGLSPPPHLEHFEHPKPRLHRRSLSVSADDPVVHQAYEEVMRDLEEVSSLHYLISPCVLRGFDVERSSCFAADPRSRSSNGDSEQTCSSRIRSANVPESMSAPHNSLHW